MNAALADLAGFARRSAQELRARSAGGFLHSHDAARWAAALEAAAEIAEEAARDRAGARRAFRLSLAALAAAALLLAGRAFAHEAPSGWRYDPECCSARDCAPVPAASVAARPEGWQVSLCPGVHPLVSACAVWTVPYDGREVRPSPDGGFHACVAPGPTPGRGQVLRCLYVPEIGW